jgi:hypothetical protein
MNSREIQLFEDYIPVPRCYPVPDLINLFDRICLETSRQIDMPNIVQATKGAARICLEYRGRFDLGHYPRVEVLFYPGESVRALAKHKEPEMAAHIINDNFSVCGALAVPYENGLLALQIGWENIMSPEALSRAAPAFRSMIEMVFCNAWLMHELRDIPRCVANVRDVTYGRDRATVHKFIYDVWNHWGTCHLRVTATSPNHDNIHGSVVIQARGEIRESTRNRIRELGGSYDEAQLIISPYMTVTDVARVKGTASSILLLHEESGWSAGHN